MDWIDLAQDRDRRRALGSGNELSSSINKRGNSWLAEDLLASQEGLCSMEWVGTDGSSIIPQNLGQFT